MNNADFAYSLADNGTITLSFLVRGRNTGNQLVALAGDANGNGQIEGGSAPGEVGFTFGIASDNWQVGQAAFGTASAVAHGFGGDGNDTYELRLLVDPLWTYMLMRA